MRAWQIHHPVLTPERIADPYPAHLHIDLLPRLQGRRIGRAMIERWLTGPRADGSKGAHLGVGAANKRAIGFYRACGWTELERDARTLWFGIAL